MAIVWIILVMLLCVHLACGVCPTQGKSGPGCVYDCHCSNTAYCDQSSNCQGQCQAGWRGMTCQQENAALRMTTESSSVNSQIQNSDKAVDGFKNINEVYEFHTSYNENNPPTSAWWSVDLGAEMSVQEVIIFFRINYTYRRNGLRIYTSTTKPTVADTSTWGQSCYNVNGWNNGSNIPNELSILACMGTWRYLFIYTITDNGGGVVLDFTEVEIYGDCSSGTYGTNCSQFCDGCNSDGCQSTGQCVTGCSTFRYGADCSMFCYGCNNDGCHSNGDCRTGCLTGRYSANCSLTCDGCNIEGCYRNGQCISGCKSGRIPFPSCNQNCSEGYYGTNCLKVCSQRGCRLPDNSCDPENGTCLNYCRNSFISTDCGDCAQGWYGDCDKQCSNRWCAFSQISPCTRYTGDCNPAGCHPGWRNNDCSTVCAQNTYYGSNCSKLCSSRKCLNPSSCNHRTGECVGGCTAGYIGIDCDQCSNNVYGENCDKNCSSRHCLGTSTSCDRLTGTCIGGCQDGWTEKDCATECLTGYYGARCAGSCSSRQCLNPSDVCHHVTGSCTSGCKPGWIAVDCRKSCMEGSYGNNCTNKCTDRKCKTASSTCDKETGQCPDGCQAGWKGGNCFTKCPPGFYGDCETRCGNCIDTCDRITGNCSGECQDGYTGARCDPQTGTNESPNYVPAIAGVVAGILVIAIIVIVIIVFRRRTGRHASSLKETSRPLQISNGLSAERSGGTVNLAMVSDEVQKTKEKPPVREKPKVILPALKSQSADPEEEILDEEQAPNRDYYNIDDTAVIREIPVGELTATIQKIKSQEGGFEAEYSRLPNGFTAPYGDSQKPENAGKNKFRGYYPYDQNRVRLSILPDVPGSDYINASLMHSYNQKKTYIAAQAPNKKTVGDFWRMIWEHRCGRVIMLTGLVEVMKEKCYQYWPDKDDLQTDHHKVEVDITDKRANYTVRHLKVTLKHSGESRSVVQYHFTSWSDHGVPDTLDFVHFLWMLRQTDTQTDGPLLVHCSAGIGRTGTYIAVDSLLDQARGEEVVDVLGYVSVMRGQRKNMIQTKEQYECVFHCLVEMTKFGNTSMDVENFTTSYSSRGMDSMVDRKTLRELTQMTVADERNDTGRNQMWVDGNEKFIVRVGPTLRHIRGYLMTVVPPPGLEKLLWKLVEENNVHDIIVISQLQEDLVGGKGSRKKCGSVTLTTSGQTNLNSDLTMTTLELKGANSEDTQNVKVLKLNGPPTLDSMSSCLLNHAHLQHLSGEITPNVIVHSESDRKCAVSLCIMGNILSGIMEDHHVDVIGHVRTFLKRCPDLSFTEQEVEKFIAFAKDFIQMTTASNIYANL